MESNYKFFVFDTNVPMRVSKGVVYISPYGTDYVSIFNSIKQYEENVGEIVESSESRNVFIDRGVYSSVVDFKVNNPTLPRDSIYLQTDATIVSIVNKLKSKYDYKRLEYDILSGDNIDRLEYKESEALNKNLKVFCYTMIQFMSAGYHKRENTKKIPDWCVCFEEPIMKYFISYFEIKTEAPDINIVDQFLTNPQFREMITICMMRVMANYVVNNALVDIKDVKSWHDTKMWMVLARKLL